MKSDFIIALTQLAAERNLPREIVLSAIEAALVSAYKKDSNAAGQEISVTLDPASGDVSVYVVKTVVEDVEDSQLEISLADAQKIRPEAAVGEMVPTDSLPHSAGRIAAQTAKQVVIQRLREAERELVFEEFSDKEGEVFTVAIQKIEPLQIVVELGRAEAILPASEQAHYERYRVGLRLKVLLQSVRRSEKGPEIIVSRTDKLLLKRLFEMEVPEIYNGSVEIVDIAREPGSRSKVAVWAKQDGVDAVGSCVGLRGIRIQNIVNELHGEKIDVVQWSKDPATYISNSLSPSSVMSVTIDSEAGSAVSIVPDRQLSLAIGKEGQNARLAARLTGWKVDIKSDLETVDAPPAEPTADEVPEPLPAEAVVAAAEAVVEATPAPVVEAVAIEPEAEPAEVVDTPVEVAAEQALEPVAAEVSTAPEVSVDQAAAVAPEVEAAKPEEELVPAVERSPSIHELPDDIWGVRDRPGVEPGVIRFAEDITELQRGAGARRGRRGGTQRRAQGPGRARRTRAGGRR